MSGVLVVAGLGRCGSSMVMRMLHAGGMQVVGTAPDYEVAEMMPTVDGYTINADWWNAQAGRAVKFLDPTMFVLPDNAAVAGTIYLKRNHLEQAASQVKFLREMFPSAMTMEARDMIPRIAASLPADDAAARASLAARGPVLDLTFEQLLADPRGSAMAIWNFLALKQSLDCFNLDIAAMTAVVLDRHAVCAPDMSIEVRLAAQAEEETRHVH